MVDGAAPVVEDTAGLLWVVNQDSVELRPWLSRKENLNYPDLLMFDLDPGSRLPFQGLCEAATVVKEALDAQGGVNSWAKASGASGLHLYRHGPGAASIPNQSSLSLRSPSSKLSKKATGGVPVTVMAALNRKRVCLVSL